MLKTSRHKSVFQPHSGTPNKNPFPFLPSLIFEAYKSRKQENSFDFVSLLRCLKRGLIKPRGLKHYHELAPKPIYAKFEMHWAWGDIQDGSTFRFKQLYQGKEVLQLNCFRRCKSDQPPNIVFIFPCIFILQRKKGLTNYTRIIQKM